MVTFDKGGRVPRLEPGAVLDARQAGIVISQTDPARSQGRSVATLTDWDQTANAATTKRIEGLLDAKGPTDKGTLLVALSLGVLREFDVRTPDGVAHLAGDRVRGFRVVALEPAA